MKMNKQEYLQLIAESNELLQEGKFLHEQDPVKINKLMHYFTMLSDDIFWKSRYQYLEIIKSFISRNVEVTEFIKKFYFLRYSNSNAAEVRKDNLANEIDFQLNPASHGFSDIIESINTTLELFDSDITLEMNLENPELIGYGISKEFLIIDLKTNYLPKICKYCKKS